MHFGKRFRFPFALASLILSSTLTTVALPQNNPGSASTTSNNSTALDPGVRAGSVKRIASAVGEGSICVQFVHRVLQETANPASNAA